MIYASHNAIVGRDMFNTNHDLSPTKLVLQRTDKDFNVQTLCFNPASSMLASRSQRSSSLLGVCVANVSSILVHV